MNDHHVRRLRHYRLAIWFPLSLVHVLLLKFPPNELAAIVASSVYAPLLMIKALGMPVFSIVASGGWGNPSPLGWIVVSLFWGVVWWIIASLLARTIVHLKYNIQEIE